MKVAMVSLLENQFQYPPIGLLRICSYLKKMRKDIEVKLIDRTFENPEEEMENFKPDVIGIITYATYYKEDVDFCKKMKRRFPNLVIVAGGPQMTTMPKSFHEIFDYGVMGQGEISMLKLIDVIKKRKKSLMDISGLVYRRGRRIIINPMHENVDPDELTKIDYGFLHKLYFKKRYVPESNFFTVSLGIMANIGCPFKCPFCSIRFCWKKPIYRKIDAVMDEIKDLYYNYGVRNIDFYDDLFAINKERLRKLKDELEKEGLLGKITLSCQARADIFDDELCNILKELNITHIAFGFESGSTKMLKYIKANPNITVEDNRRAIELCKKYKIEVSGSVMIGMPGERKEDIEATIDFMDYAKKKGVARITVYVFTLFPKTEIWELAKDWGRIDENDIRWEDHTLFDPNTAKMLHESISKDEFLNYYDIMKRKSRSFMYRVVRRTLMKNPANVVHFAARAPTYIKRYLYTLRH